MVHVPLNDVGHVDTARRVVVLSRLELHGQSAQQAPLAKSA